MTQSLIDKIRKARQTTIVTGGRTFIIRRPTDMEAVELSGQKIKKFDFLRRFVIDWPGMQEIHLIPGGSPVAVPFDADLFMEWIADQPQLWADLIGGIEAAYRGHQDKLDEAAGER